MFLKGEFSNRLVQVSLFAGIVYYITAYPVVFESARKYFPIKFKKTHHLLIFHTFVFAVLMYLLTYFVFDPIVRVVEGAEGAVKNTPDEEGKCNGDPLPWLGISGAYTNPKLLNGKYISTLNCRYDKGWRNVHARGENPLVCENDGWHGDKDSCVCDGGECEEA